MSFRQFGGINYAARHNIVGSNYNTSNNLLVTQNVGLADSYINFLSDISGNIQTSGNFDLTGNLTVSGSTSLNTLTTSGLVNLSGDVYIGSNLLINYNTSGNYYSQLSSNQLFLSGSTDYGSIDLIITSSDTTYLQIGTGDNGTEPIYITMNNTGTTYPNMRIDNNGVYINPSGDSHFNNTYTSYELNVNGNIVYSGTISGSSDYRIKEDVRSFSIDEFSVDNLKPVYFKFKENKKENIGLIAHELAEEFPFLVEGVKDGKDIQKVNYIGLIGILIKEIQELKKEVKTLKEKLL